MFALPTIVHGRRRTYGIAAPSIVTRKPDREVACSCGWRGTAADGVPYRDKLGTAVACPTCGEDVLA